MTGLEAGVEIDPLEGLTLNANYTLNYARDHSSDRVTSDVIRIPLSKIDLGLTYAFPSILTRLNLNATYVSPVYRQLPSPANPDLSKERGDDYFLLGGRITQPVTEYGEIYLAMENILDLDYEPDYGFPAPGRTFWVGARATY
jgi:outer membrane cobalamin receptor